MDAALSTAAAVGSGMAFADGADSVAADGAALAWAAGWLLRSITVSDVRISPRWFDWKSMVRNHAIDSVYRRARLVRVGCEPMASGWRVSRRVRRCARTLPMANMMLREAVRPVGCRTGAAPIRLR
ncbi:MAG: hypothetical protein JSR34_06245 [Proteobacteria bacterium]|nr:hypothetical protein [Pseudomonadota bacterium]